MFDTAYHITVLKKLENYEIMGANRDLFRSYLINENSTHTLIMTMR